MSPPARPEGHYSLRTRLVLAFGVLLVLFLGLAGLVLSRAYQESVVAAVEQRLQLHVYALLGVAEPDADGFFVPDLEEARFAQIDSGLYGFIFDDRGRELWRSPSALNLSLGGDGLGIGAVLPGEMIYGSFATAEQGAMSWASYGTYWENQGSAYAFVVLESNAPTRAQIREFQSNLYLWIGALAVFLSVAQYLLLRWGLRPLRQLAADVSAIEAGQQDQLQRVYPQELKPVTDNLNLLIKSERDRQGRYRSTLGDLAHSLKTPLAVLSTALQEIRRDQPLTETQRHDMAEQLERMDQIVSYQLQRAVRSNRHQVLARPVPVAPVLRRILAALDKVYRDKQLRISTEIDEAARFHGEESDLLELCGNLLDNACKYGAGRVEIKVRQQGSALQLEINDDGQGIAESDRQWVLQRGARADTVTSGQGIGLAVAVEIIATYGGEIQIARSAWGGASVQLRL